MPHPKLHEYDVSRGMSIIAEGELRGGICVGVQYGTCYEVGYSTKCVVRYDYCIVSRYI